MSKGPLSDMERDRLLYDTAKAVQALLGIVTGQPLAPIELLRAKNDLSFTLSDLAGAFPIQK